MGLENREESMEKKRDFRVKLTKKMLEEAYLKLRERKPLHRVTVRELCETAGVGRGTFYAHYEDVYHLHEEVENNFLQAFSESAKEAFETGDSSPRRMCRALFSLLEENRTMCLLVLDRDNARGLQKFTRLGEEMFLERVPQREQTRESARMTYRFISAGCIACLQDRLYSDRTPLPQFSDTIASLVESLLRPLRP